MNADAAKPGGPTAQDLGSLGIGLLSSGTDVADAAESLLKRRYRFADEEAAATLVALGGDGFMLQTLHAFRDLGKPVYGMNLGSVGFLMNEFNEEGLETRLSAAEAQRQGLADGAAVRVGNVTLAVAIDASVPDGTAWIEAAHDLTATLPPYGAAITLSKA